MPRDGFEGRRQFWGLNLTHGRMPLGDAVERGRGVGPNGGAIGWLDTETTGLAGGTGTYVFLVGIGAIEDRMFVVTQYFLADLAAEAERLRAVGGHPRAAPLAPAAGRIQPGAARAGRAAGGAGPRRPGMAHPLAVRTVPAHRGPPAAGARLLAQRAGPALAAGAPWDHGRNAGAARHRSHHRGLVRPGTAAGTTWRSRRGAALL